MQVLVNAQLYDLDTPFAYGGEGEIYDLTKQSVAKLYYDHLIDDERKQKVLALCNSHANFRKRHNDRMIAFPEAPAYHGTVSFDSVVGFSMCRYTFPKLDKLGFDISAGRFSEDSGLRFDDRTAIRFVYDTFGLVDQLHQSRIVLGDVNPGNIMCDPSTGKPVIIDVDAAQIGGFPCRATHDNYNDPQLLSRGKGRGGALPVDFGTDIFALAVVCFEFLVGRRPHWLRVTPPKLDKQNKAVGISSIRCIAIGRDHLSSHGVRYFPCPENESVERRVAQLKSLDKRLYDFFEGVFVRDDRENILFTLPISDVKHPANHFFETSGMAAVIRREKERRQVRDDVLARQGQRAVPDSGFKDLIASLVPSPSTPSSPKRTTRQQCPDPAEFGNFLKQFNLRLSTS
ncbi:hypothetical protein TSA1_29690 [Bradyrhizobium nitroreducens]|uniref:Protein kinase domain-containing protein n=1 Tax=Bradyrhizobium nitroreducens TaxID=709803 RepID=A0A2M6UIN0_9BRAD|nr:hypothetical protein [Bradyrhizobium nitroreducens]PIT04466.1 hypothetical protein TSA1_29690 [Bradyrhizobium nitroreducens]